MHTTSLEAWKHPHTFGQDQVKVGERRTFLVVAITASMMVIEIVAGLYYGSMALLADGIHMGSHTSALLIAAFAYVYARKLARDQRFSFGTGKVNALAGYSSAILLALFSALMAYESVHRLLRPVVIHFDQAIFVAVIGLCVNGISVAVLGVRHEHGDDVVHHDHGDHPHHHAHSAEGHIRTSADHNLKAAYLHVLADALTSVLAIFALLSGKYFHLVWMDPVMGIVGAILVARWSFGLIQETGKVLLDYQGPEEIRKKVIENLESYKDTRVSDLHLWSIGPGIYSSAITLITSLPESPEVYKALILCDTPVVHSTVEVICCPG